VSPNTARYHKKGVWDFDLLLSAYKEIMKDQELHKPTIKIDFSAELLESGYKISQKNE